MAVRTYGWRELRFAAALAVLLSACSASDGASLPDDGTGSAPGDGGPGGGASNLGGAPGGGSGAPGNGGGGGTLFGTGGSGSGPATGGSAPGGAGGASSGACSPPVDSPTPESCGNGLDDDLNGFIDEICNCTVDATQSCFDGAPSQAGLSNCHLGTQTCISSGEFGKWGPCTGSSCDNVTKTEVCDNGADDDCDGLFDEGCYFDAEVNIDGDCIGVPCPPQAPNPVGCNIQMSGGDSRGCVAHAPGNPAVYFQEGNACPIPGCGALCGDAGHISGTMRCSSQLDPVTLDATNCPINKTEPIYASDPGGCPH